MRPIAVARWIRLVAATAVNTEAQLTEAPADAEGSTDDRGATWVTVSGRGFPPEREDLSSSNAGGTPR